MSVQAWSVLDRWRLTHTAAALKGLAFVDDDRKHLLGLCAVWGKTDKDNPHVLFGMTSSGREFADAVRRLTE